MKQLWKKGLALCLCLLMVMAPWHLAQAEDSVLLTGTGTVSAEGLRAVLEALGGEALTEDDMQLLSAISTIFDAASVSVELAESGDFMRLSVKLSDQEVFYIAMEQQKDEVYYTSNLLPGTVLTLDVEDGEDVLELLGQVDFEKLLNDLVEDIYSYPFVIDIAQAVEPAELIPMADSMYICEFTNADLALLAESWMLTLDEQPDFAEVVDAWLGEGAYETGFHALLAENHAFAVEDRLLYRVKLYEQQDELIGIKVDVLDGSGTETLEQGELCLEENKVDVLVNRPLNDTDNVLVRFTLTLDGEDTLLLRFHVLDAAPGETYAQAAEKPEAELLLEQTTTVTTTDDAYLVDSAGTMRLQVDELQLALCNTGAFHDQADGLTWTEQVTLADGTPFYSFGLTGQNAAGSERPDYSKLTEINIEDMEGNASLEEALEQGGTDVMILLFKSLPSDTIDMMLRFIDE